MTLRPLCLKIRVIMAASLKSWIKRSLKPRAPKSSITRNTILKENPCRPVKAIFNNFLSPDYLILIKQSKNHSLHIINKINK
jgi:hypothetical protein